MTLTGMSSQHVGQTLHSIALTSLWLERSNTLKIGPLGHFSLVCVRKEWMICSKLLMEIEHQTERTVWVQPCWFLPWIQYLGVQNPWFSTGDLLRLYCVCDNLKLLASQHHTTPKWHKKFTIQQVQINQVFGVNACYFSNFYFWQLY